MKQRDRYLLQPSKEDGYWVCTDKINGIVVRFKHKNFNETQKLITLEDFDLKKVSAVDLATMMRKLSDWLSRHHIDKVF